ncbi:MAG: nucleotide pyrophosphohydrolase [Verrucomicrobia bacterium]|jgi:NTP pyrophosphatase (non-canonical NTP hydrolase)|nr:nucleotide pyrophosphohydrolase [Verrucomicrobiota bacterium]
MTRSPEEAQPIQLDDRQTLGELKKAVQAFARDRDWERFHSPKNLSMALAAEAGELMEHFLWADAEQSHETAKGSREVADELADVVIYAIEFANITGLDLADAIKAKMEQNGRKYPVEKARGNARKYTEL